MHSLFCKFYKNENDETRFVSKYTWNKIWRIFFVVITNLWFSQLRFLRYDLFCFELNWFVEKQFRLWCYMCLLCNWLRLKQTASSILDKVDTCSTFFYSQILHISGPRGCKVTMMSPLGWSKGVPPRVPLNYVGNILPFKPYKVQHKRTSKQTFLLQFNLLWFIK